jgi:hypothetical protein
MLTNKKYNTSLYIWQYTLHEEYLNYNLFREYNKIPNCRKYKILYLEKWIQSTVANIPNFQLLSQNFKVEDTRCTNF